jgi:hypothetical protein
MAFPTSPANGSTAVVNGITYVYSSSNSTWTRQANGAATLGSLTLASSLIASGATITGVTSTGTLTVSGTSNTGSIIAAGNVTAGNVIVAGNIFTIGGVLYPTLTTLLTYQLAF